jgi:3-dehydroquinate synthase
MRTIEVVLGDRSYPIVVGAGVLNAAASVCMEQYHPSSVTILSHPRLMALYGEKVAADFRGLGLPVAMLTVRPGERHKNLRTVERLYRELLSLEVDRKGLLIAVGGGVLGDVCGFVAATYLRGIAFVQIPTTVLAQVDASVGGKTGVDLPEGKNLVGAFHQPRAVIIDTETLATLPARELRSGLAEVVKYGMITDERLFGDLGRSIPLLLGRDLAALSDAVVRSCEIKAHIVSVDETEQGLRAILNFGHTIGHALEVVTGYRRYKHGEAISIGMVSACLIGEEAGITPPDVTEAARALLSRLRLPTKFPDDIDIDSTISATLKDKKRVGASVTYILAERIGRVAPTPGVAAELVRRALRRQQA